MLRVLGAAVTALACLAVLPAAADVESAVACGSDDGRERLTVEGYKTAFDAPVVTYPGLSSPVNNNVGPLQELRSAPFPLTVDVAPSATADVRITLDWAEVSDFDVFVFDDSTGAEIGRAAEDNTANGLTHEEAFLTLTHCQRITVAVRSWSGSALEELTLSLTVTPSSALLACAADDPAPNCAGKAAGEAPDASPPDDRTRLYLSGDAGQASMAWHYAQTQAGDNAVTQALPRARLTSDRPSGGVPNGHTRVVGGFRQDHATAWRNPLIPHWSYDFAEPTDISGSVTAVLWVSSRTIDETGRFFVDLWIDGGLEQSVEVAGSQIRQEPSRVAVTFPDVARPDARNVTLQAATEPVATSSGQVNNLREVEVTVHYGSVQFPAFVSIP